MNAELSTIAEIVFRKQVAFAKKLDRENWGVVIETDSSGSNGHGGVYAPNLGADYFFSVLYRQI